MATATRRRKKRQGRVNPLTGFDASLDEQTALDQYLRDVSRHELITPEMEKVLGARAQKGDEEAIQALARAIAAAPNHVVVVTNEVGLGVVPANALARRFRERSGNA